MVFRVSHAFFVAATLFTATFAASAQIGTVLSNSKISSTQGGFNGSLDGSDFFGSSSASLGDLDGDGVADLAVGAFGDNDGGTNRGAIWILFMNQDGSVKSHSKISDTEGGFDGVLDNSDEFGSALSYLGDINNDGLVELAAGAPGDDDGGTERGALWILSLNPNGSVAAHSKINSDSDSLAGMLSNSDRFGVSVSAIGDLNNDGIPELAVGSEDGFPFSRSGAVWILFLDATLNPVQSQRIGFQTGNFPEVLQRNDHFGASVVGLGDLNGDSIPEIAVGAPGSDLGGNGLGEVWILFLDANGSVSSSQLISQAIDSYSPIAGEGNLGNAIASLGDVDGDGITDIAVCASSTLGTERFYIFSLRSNGTIRCQGRYGSGQGGFTGFLSARDFFGSSISLIQNNKSEQITVAVGAERSDETVADEGAIWIVNIDAATCLANLNDDCIVDLADINAFVTGFLAQDPGVDLAEPFGIIDLADINAFVTSFVAGCP